MKIELQKTLTAGLLLATCLAVPVLAGENPGKTAKAARPHPAPTVEPGPPLSLNVRLVNLQKNVSGGVASVSMEARASVDLEEVTLTADLPGGVIFADGSQSKTWTFNLPAGATNSIPVDLLVSSDGKYNISLRAAGTHSGGPVRRGLAYRLLVGVEEKLPAPRDGAIEYPGVPGGGM